MNKSIQKIRKQNRVRKQIMYVSKHMRLSVFRSNKYLYAQVIDDATKKTIIGCSEKNILATMKGTKTEKAYALGKEFAKTIQDKKITHIVFDRGSYRYHGRIKSFAEGVREGGIVF